MSSTVHRHDVHPSLLPNPPAEPSYVIRFRLRIRQLTEEVRSLKRELMTARLELAALHRRMRKRTP